MRREIARLRSEADRLDSIPFTEKEILKLLEDLLRSMKHFLPKAELKEKKSNKWICNFGVKGLPMIMVERVHGSRKAIPITWRKQQINAINEALDFVESCLEQRQ